jgi:hypothetical protein
MHKIKEEGGMRRKRRRRIRRREKMRIEVEDEEVKGDKKETADVYVAPLSLLT